MTSPQRHEFCLGARAAIPAYWANFVIDDSGFCSVEWPSTFLDAAKPPHTICSELDPARFMELQLIVARRWWPGVEAEFILHPLADTNASSVEIAYRPVEEYGLSILFRWPNRKITFDRMIVMRYTWEEWDGLNGLRFSPPSSAPSFGL